ncbi:uncharacterized protein LOC144231205 [Crocuta crocuta]
MLSRGKRDGVTWGLGARSESSKPCSSAALPRYRPGRRRASAAEGALLVVVGSACERRSAPAPFRSGNRATFRAARGRRSPGKRTHGCTTVIRNSKGRRIAAAPAEKSLFSSPLRNKNASRVRPGNWVLAPLGSPQRTRRILTAHFPLTRPDWDYNTAEGSPPEPHRYRPGAWVYVKRHRPGNLESRWKGPYVVLLTTPTALKVDGIAAWVHYTHAKPADPFADKDDYLAPNPDWKAVEVPENPLKLKLRRKT